MNYVATVDGGGGECVEVPCYCSYAIENDGQYREETFELPDARTSNVAEYMAVIKALEAIKEETAPGVASVLIRSDSKLVVMQCKQRWQVRARHLRPLWRQIFSLAGHFREVQFQWVPGKEIRSVLGH